MYIEILLPSIFALYALYKKCLTNWGVISAWIMGIIIIHCGGVYPFAALALTFILTRISDYLKKDEEESRDIYQVFSNVFTACLSTILFYFTGKEMFLVMYYAVLGESISDTLAYSIGSASKKNNFNPLTFRKMKKGESGAISLLGLFASFIGGIVIGLVYYVYSANLYNYIIIILMGFVGSYADSLMGAYLQGKYTCKKCKKEVESYIHCNGEAKLIKGYRFFNNNVVNLLSNAIVFILTYLILK